MNELHTCPCGGEAEHLRAGSRGTLCHIRCKACGLQTFEPLSTGDARAQWNGIVARVMSKLKERHMDRPYCLRCKKPLAQNQSVCPFCDDAAFDLAL